MKCHDIELQKLKQEQIEWLESLLAENQRAIDESDKNLQNLTPNDYHYHSANAIKLTATVNKLFIIGRIKQLKGE